MPLYSATNAPQVFQGDSFALFDGTETPSAGLKSIAFERKQYGNLNPSPMTFSVTFPASATATILIQGSNDNVEAHFQTVSTIPFAGVTTPANYGDLGQFRYYRVNLSAYTGGNMPTVIVQR